MSEKLKAAGMSVPEEFKEESHRNQVEAVKSGNSWPTPEGAEDEEIAKAFEYYLSTASNEDLRALAKSLKEVGDEWTYRRNAEIFSEFDAVNKISNPARHAATLAAVITFISLNVFSALGVKIVLNTLISVLEKAALRTANKKVEEFALIRGNLELLADHIRTEENVRWVSQEELN